MRDMFGIGVGVLIALLALIFRPYSLPWWIGIAFGALIFCIAGADLLWRWLKRKRVGADPVALTQSHSPTGIRIVLGTGTPFETIRERRLIRNRRINIQVKNAWPKRGLTNCDVEVMSISGSLAQRCPVKIKTGFPLNPGAKEYMALASFDEAISGPPPSTPGLIHLHFPINPLSDGQSYVDAGSYDLVLTATAAESAPHTVKCRLSTADGKLKLTAR